MSEQGSPWGLPVPEQLTDQYTVFYDGALQPLSSEPLPSMLGWTDKVRATEYLDYVKQQDAKVDLENRNLGNPVLVHRTGRLTWEKVEA